MAQAPSYSVAPNDASRARILSWGGLLGIVALAIGALVLVFPKKDLLTLLRGESTSENSELTVAYLRNIIRTEPKDMGLRLLLVEQLMAAGDLDGARLTLTDALALARLSPANQQAWDRWDLAWWQARLRQAKILGREDHRREAATELLARLKRSIGSVNTPAQVFATLLAAGELHAALGVSASGQPNAQANDAVLVQDQLLTRLLTLPGASAADLSRGARLALGEGRFQQSSDLYFAARRMAVAPDERFKLLQQGVQSLLAAGQPRAAWQAAMREAQPLEAADPAWWWLAELALAAAEPREAALALRHVVAVNASAAALAKTLTPARLQLAWDTFAAAGDLPAALKVAEAALAAQPQSALWLERKAQVAEWSGLAPLALAAWLQLLKQGASERALANVFRLGPMVYDDNALLAAWLALSAKRRLTADEVAKVIEVHERLGSVDAALAFVRQARADAAKDATAGPGARDGSTAARLLGLEAKLLERAGRLAEAIALLEQLRPVGLSRDDAMRLAALHLRQGNLPLALRALQAARLDAGGAGAVFDEAYWELVADVAYEAGERPAAEAALDRLLASGKPQSYQAERAIRLRLDSQRITDALQLAAQLYPRFPDDKILYAWLDAVEAQKSPSGLRALLAALLPPHRQKLETSPDFLARRASLFVRLGDVALARRDYQQALALRADDAPTRVSYWWLLVDQQDKAALRSELARMDRAARGDAANRPIYGDVMAAAWQLLDEPQLALAALQPAARGRVNDFLWLMNYADVLDRTQRQSQALRVRRHAWLVAARAAAKPVDAEQARQALVAQLRLAADFAGGDKKARLWRDLGLLVNPAKGAPQEPALQRQTKQRQAQELVAAWLLSEGQFDAARRWLWQLHAARVAAPAYQELAVALSQNDLQALVRLLDRAQASEGAVAGPVKDLASGPAGDPSSQRLSPQDRLAALRQLLARDDAATLGFELAQRRAEGEGDEAQKALQDDLLANASRVSVQERTRNAGVLTRQEVRANALVVASPRLKFMLDMSIARDRSVNTAQLAATPAHDRELRAGIETMTPWGALKAQWGVRDALATVPSLLLQFNTRLGNSSVLQLEAAKGERSEESSAMSVAGKRDRLAASLNLRADGRLDGQANLATNRFHTQTGAALGSSVDAALTGNWTLRRDYPDVRLQGQLRRSVVRADGQPDAATAVLQPGGTVPGVGLFLGPSSTAASISLGVGLAQADPGIYTRAWRPWGEIGFETRQTPGVRQTQGLLRFGAKGTVAGRDQLSVNLDVRPGSGGLSGAQATRELRLQYDIFFDR